ncbi:DUF4336 domain-containing protein [Consotaella aegiceratis]|uniref:DUF4336 domain-containing protein n=1 Tax=Consotaella aegiceratis TaxID=3097961 RepID=UPI002F42133D
MTRLQPIDEDIWLCEGPVVAFYTLPYPTRMVVVRLDDGSLWIWSPIALDDELKTEIEGLGSPAHLVSPNKLHHLAMGEWAAAFPGVRLWALPALMKKRRDLHFETLGDEAPEAWRGEIDQVVFRGSPMMEETVFFHRRSRTAIFADLIENFSDEFLASQKGWHGWRTRLAHLCKITEPDGMAPLEWRFSWLDRDLGRQALATVMSWAPEKVVIAHGTWADHDGQVFIARGFRWLRQVALSEGVGPCCSRPF